MLFISFSSSIIGGTNLHMAIPGPQSDSGMPESSIGSPDSALMKNDFSFTLRARPSCPYVDVDMSPAS